MTTKEKGLFASMERRSVQLALRGMWSEASIEGCPHLVGRPEEPDRCGDNADGEAMSCCAYQLGERCETFRLIIEEWKEEFHIYERITDPFLAPQKMKIIGGIKL